VPAILVINKIDTVKKEKPLPSPPKYAEARTFDAIVPISAKKGEGITQLLAEFEKHAISGPQLFPDGMVTDQPEKQIVAEIVREKILICLEQEIPPAQRLKSRSFPNATTGSSILM
jgi:GTP-binding protein Era